MGTIPTVGNGGSTLLGLSREWLEEYDKHILNKSMVYTFRDETLRTGLRWWAWAESLNVKRRFSKFHQKTACPFFLPMPFYHCFWPVVILFAHREVALTNRRVALRNETDISVCSQHRNPGSGNHSSWIRQYLDNSLTEWQPQAKGHRPGTTAVLF